MIETSAYKWLDIAGNPIRRNAYIVYAVNIGDSAGLKWGRVIECKEKTREWTEAISYKIFIASVELSSWRDAGPTRQRNCTLSFLDRVMVVPETSVPENIKKLLEGDKFSE